ncbi:hypothetical protein GCM10007073_04000 [Micrococcus flavus]|nr:hypothetical protein GCM10007073_04000 [Micrococcus flavus]
MVAGAGADGGSTASDVAAVVALGEVAAGAAFVVESAEAEEPFADEVAGCGLEALVPAAAGAGDGVAGVMGGSPNAKAPRRANAPTARQINSRAAQMPRLSPVLTVVPPMMVRGGADDPVWLSRSPTLSVVREQGPRRP